MFMKILYIGQNIFLWTEIPVSFFLVWQNAGKVGSGGKGSLQSPQKSINSHQWVNKDAICLKDTSEYFIFKCEFQISSFIFICLRSMNEIPKNFRFISLALSFGEVYHPKELHTAKRVDENYQLHRSSLLKKRCLTFTSRKKEA